jgi:DNA end-binding protein Ku
VEGAPTTKRSCKVGPVENADIAKGYEVCADTYVLLEPEEIDAVKLESKRTIDLVKFVDAKDIDNRYFERPYFLVPADEMAGEGYAVIRDALRITGKVGLAQLTRHGARVARSRRAAAGRPRNGAAALRR